MDDQTAIRRVVSDWLAASRAGDLPAILELMSDDVVFLTPGNPPMRGKEAFAQSFRRMIGKVHLHAESDIQEIEVNGDQAWAWSHLRVTITPPDGGSPKRHSGNTLSIFRKQPDGRWVIARDANMLAPEPEK